MVVDIVKAALDVPFNDPGVRHSVPVTVLCPLMRQGGAPDILQGRMRAPSRPKPVRDMPKLRLEDWLQENFDRALNNAILHRRNAQGRNCPGLPAFGMSLRRDGLGRYAPERNSDRSLSRKRCSPSFFRMLSAVTPSTPADRAPLFEATRRQAWRRMRGSVSQPHKSRQTSLDVPDSTDRVCAERRVSKPHRPRDPCPQIIPPSRYSIVFLLPFALCVALPRSDYYGSSALGVVLLRPLRLAQFPAGRTIRVPVFRSSTFVPLDGGLYPWRCWRRPRKVWPPRMRCTRPAVGSYQPHRISSQNFRRHHGTRGDHL